MYTLTDIALASSILFFSNTTHLAKLQSGMSVESLLLSYLPSKQFARSHLSTALRIAMFTLKGIVFVMSILSPKSVIRVV